MIDMQKLVDMLGDSMARERSNYHVTLGGLIARLEQTDSATPVVFDCGGAPHEPDSYRGYYSDLALSAHGDEVTAGKLLAELKAANGTTFQGYKGGDFTMGNDTPLWCAEYGCCGLAIIDAQTIDGKLVLKTKQID